MNSQKYTQSEEFPFHRGTQIREQSNEAVFGVGRRYERLVVQAMFYTSKHPWDNYVTSLLDSSERYQPFKCQVYLNKAFTAIFKIQLWSRFPCES